MRYLLLPALCILLAGCISVEYDQAVHRDGSSLITENVDLNALLALSNVSQMASPCQNITGGEDVACTYSDGVLSLSQNFTADSGAYSFNRTFEFPYVIYTLEARRLPQLADTTAEATGSLAGSTNVSGNFSSPSSRLAGPTLRAAGVQITYVIEMPGEIFEAQNGQVTDGRAKYDVLELMSKGKDIVVRSREPDLLALGLIGIAALAVLGAAGYLFFGKRK
jgi:hypothetical protein